MTTTEKSLKLHSIKKFLEPVIGLSVLLSVTWILRKELRAIQLEEVLSEIHRTSPFSTLLAVLTTFVCYFLLTSYDFLAFRYLKVPLSYARVLFAAFIGYTFSNNLSMTPSVAIRFRIYSAWGVTGEAITKVVIFHLFSTWIGFLTVSGIISFFEPLPKIPALHLSHIRVHVVGFIFLLLVGIYFVFIILRYRPVHIRKLEIQIPSLKITFWQFLVASIDWTLTGMVLYFLIPDSARISYGQYLMIYLIAQTVGINSHLPGGLGAFEGTVVLLLSPYFTVSALVGSLLLYRIIYYLVPLLLGAILLGIFEFDQHRK